jgi:hypothetical protein
MGKPLSQFKLYPFPFASASTKSELKLELQGMSALPPKTDMTQTSLHVRFVPEAIMCSRSKSPALEAGVFKCRVKIGTF